MRLKACILIIFFVLTGCIAESKETTSPERESIPTQIKLVPVDLFKGEAAKFKPFLGQMSGAFKLKYEGSKPNAKLDIDIWKDGRRVDSVGSIGDLFYSPDEQKNNEVEVIVSIDTVSNEEKDETCIIKVANVDRSGSGLVTFQIPWDKKLTARGLIQDAETRTFTADQAVHVFGMQATSSNTIRTSDLSTESLSQTEWALVFTLRLEE
ncbi:hypothetical protein FHS19_003437 [Paenibacillus rhizosphaerae]|uniref:Lipoprotein n=1 Tax=Paenibacillus rhizosphaerae TaxID=297318 RepID=A0A839TPV8_9BACL|nr:hypothetical protein [Paenibacillus rhizosphaerae]MBB3128762.1 hypothetical protein [Paenibacillus rhizosphaerae]